MNGIVKCNVNGEEYTFWTHVSVTREHVKKELRKRFPGRLIIRELNMIDLVIPEENLPVEIQSTITSVDHRPGRKTQIGYSQWEGVIRKQIEQNIFAYDACLFFFDSELLRSMQNTIDRKNSISINMIWFRNFIKEGKLKVFTVSYDGIIEEKQFSDFDFLVDVSQTCPIAAKSDDIILNNNKLKIYTNVVRGYEFTQEEIDKFDDDYEKYRKIKDIKIKPKIGFLTTIHTDKRANIYGNILISIGHLSEINNLMKKKCENIIDAKYAASILGIFDTSGGITKFIDRFEVCKYFPGYLRNKEMWDKLKGYNLNWRQFNNVMTGKNDVIKGLDYYFNDKCLS